MYRDFKKYIVSNNLFQKNQRLLLACSGGADSMCLLHLLQLLANDWQLQIVVCHVNHNLRGLESERDAAFVSEYCLSQGLQFELASVDVKKLASTQGLSVEQAARQLRYQALHQVMERCGCELIVTAHNKNDQAETFLLNMLRGSALSGLKGMLPKHGSVVRPLLDSERLAIEGFCAEHNLRYCHDSSNDSHEYLRNRVRHELMPLLKQYNPNILTSIADNMINLRHDALYLDQQAASISADVLQLDRCCEPLAVHISLSKLNNLQQAIASRVLLLALKRLLGHTQGFGRAQLLPILALAQASSGSKQLKLAHGILVQKTYTELVISATSTDGQLPRAIASLKITQPGDYKFATATLRVTQEKHVAQPKSSYNKIYIPANLAKDEIVVRTRQAGDHFVLNNGGHKTVKSFFIDAKINKDERDQVPLLYIGNQLICILGQRLIGFDSGEAHSDYLVIEYKK